jgi:hypothetical protein
METGACAGRARQDGAHARGQASRHGHQLVPGARQRQVMWWCHADRSIGSFNLSWLEEDVNRMGHFVFVLIGLEGWGM